MNNSLSVSVVLPVYNASDKLSIAIESILNQTFKDFELILIDDCSKDNSAEIIQNYVKMDPRIVFIKNEENLKLSKTLNRGIDIAKGKYIVRMDADDFSFPDRLEKQYNYMEANPEIGVSGGSMEIMDYDGNTLRNRFYLLNDSEIREKVFFFSPFSHPTIIIRKDVLLKVGLYNHDFNPAEDYELYFRIGEISKFGNLKDMLIKYRITPGSMTFGGTKKMEMQTIRIRNLYFGNKNYPSNIVHRLYNMVQYISGLIVPSSWRVKIFNFFRDKK